ncbi:MAG: hypothetical protein Q9160_007554 [Pyrenula sp. 1 TL-2023]
MSKMERANGVIQDYDNGDENFKNLYSYLFKIENLQAVKDVFQKFTTNEIKAENRIEQRTTPGGVSFLYDTDIDQRFRDEWASDLQRCREDSDSNPLTRRMLAFTSDGGGIQPSQITLCPWYLKKMITERTIFEFQPGTKEKVRDWLLQSELWTKLPGLSTKMDNWALLDHTLAHELTHTWRGGQTNTRDDDEGRKEQYEWNSITKDDVKAWGHENADNFAYYALGVRMIQDPTPFIVQKDGNLKAKDNSPATKPRSLEPVSPSRKTKRWWG